MSVFGFLLSPWNVEQAVLTTLEEWLPSYAAELERKNELPQRTLNRPMIYHGGLDWLSVKEDRMPEVVVVCNPLGEPERGPNVYKQPFLTEVGCVCKSEEGTTPEDHVRRNAGLLSAGVMGALVQHGNLGTFEAERTVLVGAPRVEFLESEDRRFAVGITGFHVFADIINDLDGPLLTKVSPGSGEENEGEYAEWPEVKTHKETVTAEPTATPL